MVFIGEKIRLCEVQNTIFEWERILNRYLYDCLTYSHKDREHAKKGGATHILSYLTSLPDSFLSGGGKFSRYNATGTDAGCTRHI